MIASTKMQLIYAYEEIGQKEDAVLMRKSKSLLENAKNIVNNSSKDRLCLNFCGPNQKNNINLSKYLDYFIHHIFFIFKSSRI